MSESPSDAESVEMETSNCHEQPSDLSIVLDNARPRSALVAPPLISSARPFPARVSNRHPKVPALVSDQSPQPRSRSQSLQSRQESVASNASTVVQVSSNDPKAAARATAILKIHHHYIQGGCWPDIQPDSVVHHVNGQDGEWVLDELLREAELEVSMSVGMNGETGLSDTTVEIESIQDPHISMSARRNERMEKPRRLAAWTRHDWRALEQCFIDERRRTKNLGEELSTLDVVQLYLDSEQLGEEDCDGEWNP